MVNKMLTVHTMTMLAGHLLLKEQNIKLPYLSHRNFSELKYLLEANSTDYHKQACEHIAQALRKCYGNRVISLQQLSATFRRGDLLEMLRI